MALINPESGDSLSGLLALIADPKAYTQKLDTLQESQTDFENKIKELRVLQSEFASEYAQMADAKAKFLSEQVAFIKEVDVFNVKQVEFTTAKVTFADVQKSFAEDKKYFDDFKAVELQKIKDENARCAVFLKETVTKSVEIKQLFDDLAVREDALKVSVKTFEDKFKAHEDKLAKLKSFQF